MNQPKLLWSYWHSIARSCSSSSPIDSLTTPRVLQWQKALNIDATIIIIYMELNFMIPHTIFRNWSGSHQLGAVRQHGHPQWLLPISAVNKSHEGKKKKKTQIDRKRSFVLSSLSHKISLKFTFFVIIIFVQLVKIKCHIQICSNFLL